MRPELPAPRRGSQSGGPLARRGPEDRAVASAPVSAPGSTFRRFCYRYGVVGNLFLGMGVLVPPAALLAGALAAGLPGAAAGAALGVGAFSALANRITVFGNGRLRRELAGRLGIHETDLEFVGLCLPENNTVQGKLFTLRLETDDNVGFLGLGEHALNIRLEEGTLRIPRLDIREVTTERFVELPYLKWIAVHYYEAGSLRTLLLCSRQCRSLREARVATGALLTRLVDWYTEPVIQELDRARWARLEESPRRPEPEAGLA
jgi:hypothetical protein